MTSLAQVRFKVDARERDEIVCHVERTCNSLAVFWPTMDLAEI